MERELIVIAKREAQLRVTREGITSVEGADVSSLANILASESAVMRPLFGINEEQIQARIASVAVETNADVPDLSLYYRVEAPDERLEELAARLREQGVVEFAYVKPAAELPIALDQVSKMFHHMVPLAEEAPSVSPDFTVRQAYLDAAPGGIDARYAWTQSGSGAGVGIIDIEGAWRFTHEDLRQNQGGVVGGTQSTDLVWRNHGTAVVGEFGSDRNTFGCTGICPDANVRAISIFGELGSAAAIRLAADMLNPGDIILIELHRAGPRSTGIGQEGLIAIEWWPDDFDAIRYATSRGVIVVEAAGNGAENLDDPIYNTPAPGFPSNWTNPFNRTNRDSGAIVVGAGAPPPNTHGRDHGPDRSRLDFSNYGSLIDAQGWGREVTTCGYGNLQGGSDEDLWYTDTFGGTSSASPIVVGALACLQSILRSRGKSPVSPSVARNLLRSTGSPQQDAPGRPRNQRIGNRPNIREMLAEVTGKMSQLQPVLTFDGIDDYVEVPYTEKHNPKVFTVSCWVKLTQVSTNPVVLVDASYTKKPVKEGYYLSKVGESKHWNFSVLEGSSIATSLKAALNTWTHLAGTFDGSQSKLYINGQFAGKKEGSHVVNTRIPLYIGAGSVVETNVPGYFLIGQMAEVCIWNKARTQQEIQSDMNKRLTGTEEGLVGYWPLNEGCGNTAIDKTGNGNNGIIKGGAIWKQQEISLEPAKPTTGKDTKTASGRTTPGATNWQAERSTTIYVDVDTSAAGFTTTPVYVTSIGGDSNHWRTTGGSSVYAATATGFRVFLRWDRISVNEEALTPADANNYKWHINWIGSEP
jgi:hypothetical protein